MKIRTTNSLGHSQIIFTKVHKVLRSSDCKKKEEKIGCSVCVCNIDVFIICKKLQQPEKQEGNTHTHREQVKGKKGQIQLLLLGK